MSSAEFSDWIQFYSMHPFGSERDNLHVAMLCALTGNINRGKRDKAYTVDDFMVMTQQERKKSETQQFIGALSALAKPKGK